MKHALLMIGMIFISVFLGNMIGEMAAGTTSFAWLGKSYQIGISTTEIDLHIIILTFGLQVKVCIAEVILLLVTLLTYSKLAKLIFS